MPVSGSRQKGLQGCGGEVLPVGCAPDKDPCQGHGLGPHKMLEIVKERFSESVDLGEIMFSLCYLPTAGRLTLTVIKCRNLKAMDITGYSALTPSRPKAPLESTHPNACPSTEAAITHWNMRKRYRSLCLSLRVGHNEIIGVCRVGIHAEGLGRDHWNEMLAYPRKPIAHWHSLAEVKKSFKEVVAGPSCQLRQRELVPISKTTSDTMSSRPHDTDGTRQHSFLQFLDEKFGDTSGTIQRDAEQQCGQKPQAP
ncbi:hypothetical protein MC885_018318 [Smutsia gigantea]|nr:hypothetical protein MC885_018318 [Smutsia gigantea]